MNMAKQKLKKLLKQARKLNLCVDGWSKIVLSASFIGVLACFYNPPRGQDHLAMLKLHRMETIAWRIDQTLEEWGIGQEKVLLIVIDDRINIVKAEWFLQNQR